MIRARKSMCWSRMKETTTRVEVTTWKIKGREWKRGKNETGNIRLDACHWAACALWRYTMPDCVAPRYSQHTRHRTHTRGYIQTHTHTHTCALLVLPILGSSRIQLMQLTNIYGVEDTTGLIECMKREWRLAAAYTHTHTWTIPVVWQLTVCQLHFLDECVCSSMRQTMIKHESNVPHAPLYQPISFTSISFLCLISTVSFLF